MKKALVIVIIIAVLLIIPLVVIFGPWVLRSIPPKNTDQSKAFLAGELDAVIDDEEVISFFPDPETLGEYQSLNFFFADYSSKNWRVDRDRFGNTYYLDVVYSQEEYKNISEKLIDDIINSYPPDIKIYEHSGLYKIYELNKDPEKDICFSDDLCKIRFLYIEYPLSRGRMIYPVDEYHFWNS